MIHLELPKRLIGSLGALLAGFVLWGYPAAAAPEPTDPAQEARLATLRHDAIILSDVKTWPDAAYEHLKGHQVVLVGEIHGTNEAAPIVRGISELLHRHGHHVVVGLEIHESEQGLIDRFWATGNQNLFLESPFFRRSIQDGRSSEAMVRLLADLRRLSGLQVVCIDVSADTAAERDAGMAANIVQALARRRDATAVVLTGNYHTPELDTPYPRMGWVVTHTAGTGLSPDRVLALTLSSPGGTAWAVGTSGSSSATGGVLQFPKKPNTWSQLLADDCYFVPFEEPKAGLNGLIFVRTMTASPPFVPSSDRLPAGSSTTVAPKELGTIPQK